MLDKIKFVLNLIKSEVNRNPGVRYFIDNQKYVLVNRLYSVLSMLSQNSILTTRILSNQEHQVLTWLHFYINEMYQESRVLCLSTTTEVANNHNVDWYDKDNMSIVPQTRDIPNLASGILLHNYRPIYFTGNGQFTAVTTLSLPWNHNKFWELFINYIKQFFHEKMSKYQMVYYVETGHGNLARFSPLPRNMEAVTFDDNAYILTKPLNKLYEDILVFLESYDEFKLKKIPYKLTTLLYGIPGTGKSEFVKRLASQLCLPLYCLNSQNVDDSDLVNLFNSITNGIVLVEEVDSCIKELNKDEDVPRLVAWHEVLDNIRAQRLLVFFTTNNYNKLKNLNYGSFCRSQRIDNCVNLSELTTTEINDLLYKRFGQSIEEFDIFEKDGKTMLTVADTTSAIKNGRGVFEEAVIQIEELSKAKSSRFMIKEVRKEISVTKRIS